MKPNQTPLKLLMLFSFLMTIPTNASDSFFGPNDSVWRWGLESPTTSDDDLSSRPPSPPSPPSEENNELPTFLPSLPRVPSPPPVLPDNFREGDLHRVLNYEFNRYLASHFAGLLIPLAPHPSLESLLDFLPALPCQISHPDLSLAIADFEKSFQSAQASHLTLMTQFSAFEKSRSLSCFLQENLDFTQNFVQRYRMKDTWEQHQGNLPVYLSTFETLCQQILQLYPLPEDYESPSILTLTAEQRHEYYFRKMVKTSQESWEDKKSKRDDALALINLLQKTALEANPYSQEGFILHLKASHPGLFEDATWESHLKTARDRILETLIP